MPDETCLVHASCVALDGAGVLLRGPAGSGKSDLALRLIDSGAGLVADDQCVLTRTGEALSAEAPVALAGLLEVRGIGIVRLPVCGPAPVRLVVDLVAADAVERLPEPAFCDLLGLHLAQLCLAPFQASAPAKIALAVKALGGGGEVAIVEPRRAQ
ncbi:MAG: HPr kinase/phosphatase C-terminal domain-containing protein [Alphaproteobacteria bacterium]|nr:HPr kinase/phosphatase C-terminal domain-containing protein [Alphaproteobacteria bacterium]